MSTKDVSVPASSVWILNIQISVSPLLILKEALHVIHKEIKKEKRTAFPPFLPPPQALCPFFSHKIIWMWQEERASQKRATRPRQGEIEKHRQRRQTTNSLPPSSHLCCSSNPHTGSWRASSFWWMTGPLPADPGTHTGDERARDREEYKRGLSVCAFTGLCLCVCVDFIFITYSIPHKLAL